MTHTMIPGPITSWSKSLLQYKSKPKVMDVVAADKTNLMKEKKDGPCSAMLKVNPALGTPCLGPMDLET